jgi:hypothetical protein
MRIPMEQHVQRLMDGVYTGKKGGYSRLLRNFGIYFALKTVAMLSLMLCMSNTPYVKHPNWAYYVSLSCGHDTDKINFFTLEMAISLFQFYVVGGYAGCLVDAKFYQGSHSKIHNTGWGRSLARFALNIVIIAGFVGPLEFVAFELESAIARIFIAYFLCPFAVGFYLFGFSKHLSAKLNLLAADEHERSASLDLSNLILSSQDTCYE